MLSSPWRNYEFAEETTFGVLAGASCNSIPVAEGWTINIDLRRNRAQTGQEHGITSCRVVQAAHKPDRALYQHYTALWAIF